MIDAEYEKAVRTYSSRIHIPGFRQGKVPRQIVEQKFGKEIEQDVVETLIRECSMTAIKEKELRPLHSPVLKDYKFERGTGLSFVAEFEVTPRVDPTGYKEIKVERSDVVVSDGDVQKAVEDLRERRARFEAVEGRGVEQDDFILADIRGTFEEGQGDPLSHPDAFFQVGSAGPHPELTDELKGMSPADERTFGVNYPEDHPSEVLAGKRVVFTAKLKEIKSRHLPELDDEFAKEVGVASTLEELRGKVREELLATARSKESSHARRQAIDQILQANPEIEVPESMVDNQVEGAIEDMLRSMAAQGIDPQTSGVDLDRARKEQREPARRSVKAALLLDAIAEKEGIEVAPKDLDEALEKEARRRKQSAGALRAMWEKEGRLDALERHLMREKVLDLVLGASNI
jgi:trigger factor